MKKRSKRLSESASALNDRQNWLKSPQDWTKNDGKVEKEKMIERRKAQTEGVEICPKCGGILWNLGEGKRCGDCFCYL